MEVFHLGPVIRDNNDFYFLPKGLVWLSGQEIIFVSWNYIVLRLFSCRVKGIDK